MEHYQGKEAPHMKLTHHDMCCLKWKTVNMEQSQINISDVVLGNKMTRIPNNWTSFLVSQPHV